jgi:membrane protein implicated in regulation of membrane protease activity
MEWLEYWHWLTFALVLVIAETLGAGGFLIALGMAAASAGILTWLFNVNWQWQLFDFSILCVLFAFGWWQFLKQHTIESPTLLNRPFEAMVGRTVPLLEGIENGRGKIKINDAHWFVTGPELPAGSIVKIVGVEEGTLLVVVPV